MEIVVLDAFSFNPGDIDWTLIERFGHTTVYGNTPPELIAQRLAGADIAFTNRARIGEREFAAAPNLRFLGLFATGFDKIDLAAARKHNIAVCNAPGYSTESVAQHAIALMLAITNRAVQFDAEVHKGRWTQTIGDCSWDAPVLELCGKTFGVLGTGEIGCRAARIASALGMRILGYSRSRRSEFCGEYVSKEELLKQADVLSLHCAANDETRGIIGEQAFSRMKPTAILINTARGSLVEEKELAAALNEGRLYAAGIDVSQVEPIPEDSPLLNAKNCLITPHVAWIPRETRTRLMKIAAENLEVFLNGGRLNRVD